MPPTVSQPANVHIGKVIQRAMIFNFKNPRKGAMATGTLLQNVVQLFALLEERKIDYSLVGGIALLHYIEGRNTEDIDLIMALSSLKQLPEIDVLTQDVNFARGQFGELQIDILRLRHQLFEKVHQHYATPQRFREQTIPCATVEGLLLLKLYALPSLYRQGNFTRVGLYENDIATLMYRYHPDMAPVLQELSPHLSPPDTLAVRDIVSEIEHKIDRFDNSFKAPA